MRRFAAAIIFLGALTGCHRKPDVVRIGYELNLASAPALLGAVRGDFRRELHLPVLLTGFNAGPGVVDALIDGRLDFAYLDPIAAVSANVRSRGRYVIVAGSTFGGGVLIVSTSTASNGLETLRDGRVATPQAGSAADVAARHFFSARGFVSREQGGEFQIVPVANVDVVRAFQRQDVSAVWTSEPWASSLQDEAGGVVFTIEPDAIEPAGLAADPSIVVVARRSLVKWHPDLVAAFLRAHLTLLDDVSVHEGDARPACERELSAISGHAFRRPTLDRAWTRLSFSAEIPVTATVARAYDGFRIGFLGPAMPDLRPAFMEAPLRAAESQSPRR